MCPTAGYTDVTVRLLHKLILRPPAQFWCCQLLITKLSVTIYNLAMYKQKIVSIDVITQRKKDSHNLLHDCLQKIVILVVFMAVSFRGEKKASVAVSRF